MFKILTSTHTGKSPLGRPRRRWEGNIRMKVKEIDINARIGLIPLNKVFSNNFSFVTNLTLDPILTGLQTLRCAVFFISIFS